MKETNDILDELNLSIEELNKTIKDIRGILMKDLKDQLKLKGYVIVPITYGDKILNKMITDETELSILFRFNRIATREQAIEFYMKSIAELGE